MSRFFYKSDNSDVLDVIFKFEEKRGAFFVQAKNVWTFGALHLISKGEAYFETGFPLSEIAWADEITGSEFTAAKETARGKP